ncbi:unnamed protein product [Rotaria magnacalcarata]|uniref:BHLH domain-containing protein n=2 Tax=Rotaria magnacalcarata TaxID=392030 RepID=A0A816N5P3_9BILA|nr:unnamed protein product [Rotaria magnacalcarata]CAF1439977.1 unnamed protein product [Rotaria magnacalcarata]CAF2009465.1 unnamed protein product [Rotaria magnacalcarata]CAF2092481.1 unnamed protein product [Rotaria magnacalcarata]CAF2134650.1 unnamed protein product [Rotaria magnacalcarata]
MTDITMLKLKPIEIDSNHVVISTNTVTPAIQQSNPIKRSRKSAHPSKTIQTPTESYFISLLTKNTTNIPIEELITASTSTDDDSRSLPHFDEQENTNDDPNTGSDEETSITCQSVTSKRSRLTSDKRLEANARERERVHNLTAAFESLRQVIPMYGDQQKLSRLSILRIACSYVLVLGALNEIDFSQEQNAYTFNECFHILSSTILNELKRKKSK